MPVDTVICGDAAEVLKGFPSESVNMCVTSPPYFGLRDYGMPGQIGNEPSPEEYISRLLEVFREVRRVLREDGTLWLIIGDSYAGSGRGIWSKPVDERPDNKQLYLVKGGGAPETASKLTGKLKPKDMIGIPWMLAFAMRDDGWYLRSDVIWEKPNCLPEPVSDRPTKSYEHVFIFARSAHYYYDKEAVMEPIASSTERRYKSGVSDKNKYVSVGIETGQKLFRPRSRSDMSDMRNKRDVWRISTNQKRVRGHYAIFPEKLVEPCVLAGCPENGIVLDPFFGSGTTGYVAKRLGRRYIGIDLNPDYCALAEKRISETKG